ncbi:hypothetical protein LTR86_007920 [Recurvomyces mirabilis]|nr:hypothetical protein LTR86_007920 [Recurvomyces mirabilis]
MNANTVTRCALGAELFNVAPKPTHAPILEEAATPNKTMRLINVNTYALSEFLESDVPPYAILSHTWGQDEVSYQDMQKLKLAKKKKGFAKIAWACLEASLAGIQWAWVDTCCIDKTSSAELQEAINSMYRWYAEAQVCYAYLGDVSRMDWTVDDHHSLRASKWFTRGWTLQELIAPQDVRFYGQDWFMLFEGSQMVVLLSDITKVDITILRHETELSSINIAKRMSWAAFRQTSRTEDMAYCLLGLFGVSIPMLYGEGKRSFHRLQEEIIRTSNDHSIFAWGVDIDRHTNDLLASSPVDFQGCHDIVSWGRPGQYEMTNRGLRINLPMVRQEAPTETMPWSTVYEEEEFLGVLNCRHEHVMDSTLALRLQKFREEDDYIVSSGRQQIFRLLPVTLENVTSRSMNPIGPSLVTIAREFENKESPLKFWFRLAESRSANPAYEVSTHFPSNYWTGSVMHPRSLDSRRSGLDESRKARPGRSETAVQGGVAVSLYNRFDGLSTVEDRVLFAFGYHMVQRRQDTDETIAASADKLKLSPTMAISMSNQQSLSTLCAQILWCADHPRECTSHAVVECPYNLGPRRIQLYTKDGGIWQISVEMRERSIMGETTFVVNAEISHHHELGGIMIPAELEATEWRGETPMYNKHDADSYPYTSRMGAWQEALELRKEIEALYGSFAILVSNLMAVNAYSWDDVMGDKDIVELEATQWRGHPTGEASPKISFTSSAAVLAIESGVRYAVEAWQDQEAINKDVRNIFGDRLCIPITYLTSMVPLTTVDRELEMNVYKSLGKFSPRSS